MVYGIPMSYIYFKQFMQILITAINEVGIIIQFSDQAHSNIINFYRVLKCLTLIIHIVTHKTK